MASVVAPTHVAEAQVVATAEAGARANHQELAAQHLDPGRGLFLPVQGLHQKGVLRQGNIHQSSFLSFEPLSLSQVLICYFLHNTTDTHYAIWTSMPSHPSSFAFFQAATFFQNNSYQAY